MKLKNVVLGIIAASAVAVNGGWLAYEHIHPLTDAYYSSNAGLYPNGVPKILYLSGKRWNIEIGEHDDELDAMEAFGVTMCKERVIHLHSNMVQANYRDTLLHESLHATICKDDGSLDNDAYSHNGGHAAIAKFSQSLQDILRDNPEFAEFMLHWAVIK